MNMEESEERETQIIVNCDDEIVLLKNMFAEEIWPRFKLRSFSLIRTSKQLKSRDEMSSVQLLVDGTTNGLTAGADIPR